MIPLKYAFLFGDIIFLLIWLAFFWQAPGVRKKMLLMSALIGATSIISAYYWWTIDW